MVWVSEVGRERDEMRERDSHEIVALRSRNEEDEIANFDDFGGILGLLSEHGRSESEREAAPLLTAGFLLDLFPRLVTRYNTLSMDSIARSNPTSYDSELSYVRHSDLDLSLSFKLSSFQGHLAQRSLLDLVEHPELKHHGHQQQSPPELYVSLALYADNVLLVPRVQSSYKSFKSVHSIEWNELFTLPIKIRDLPISSQLVVTVYDIAGPDFGQREVVGGSTLRLFGNKSTLKKGKQRLYLWKGKEGDTKRRENETPSKVGLRDEMGRLEKLVKKQERGDVERLDWLDKLAFRQIEKIHKVSISLKPGTVGGTC